ncbi:MULTISPECIES: GNAT family protein [unclassified Arthrobacter]|uniref:GNAT family N-acetyltransferase n=1 Tax=unclassified Arthrobacter TaxID=235627 RepID=UPI0024E023E9|nr:MULTISPECIES: GNAT family protein [unclassified Arthrobacter]MCC9144067.1 GNAT family N-acetyltransferase [Arthrobacter sp. zg-Y919]MDK1275292.1 GNAT family protein [Arthrobacter sp. zg.Y919]WIB03313.1 GNAT family protein [Arthrobacter sp. zg-Y919]
MLPVLTGVSAVQADEHSPGPRVTVRAFTADDVALVQSASTDPLIPLITSVPSTGGREEALAFIERQHHRASSGAGWSFAIADEATGTAVGQIGLWPGQSSRRTGNPDTIGYWVGPDHRKRGYAGAALAVLTDWAMTVQQMPRIDLYIEPWNEGSWRTAEKAGYQRDALLPAWQKVGTAWRDMYRYIRAEKPAASGPRKSTPKIG